MAWKPSKEFSDYVVDAGLDGISDACDQLGIDVESLNENHASYGIMWNEVMFEVEGQGEEPDIWSVKNRHSAARDTALRLLPDVKRV